MSNEHSSPSHDVLREKPPAEAIRRYFRSLRGELQDATIKTHRYALAFFSQWCDQNEIEFVCELDGFDLEDYHQWRRLDATEKVDSLSRQTDKSQMDILRSFIGFCESNHMVREGLSDKVPSPDTNNKNSRVQALDEERAEEILDWLETYEYASVEHVCWALLWSTGMRLGAARSIDLRDYHPEEDVPRVELRHRPDTDTPLKQQNDSERSIFLTDDLCAVIDDYLENRRPDVTDDHGREPLLASTHGRIAASTIRKYVYKWSRPCQIGKECPHGEDMADCDSLPADKASQCPSSVPPHALRRGYITDELKQEVPKDVLADRCDLSKPVLVKHYDKRSEDEKMKVRRQRIRQARREGESTAEST
ncbi:MULTISPECIES: site-specific integrase [Halobacterium]|uniref:tyrosine-type recombinase/integrase n=1 Tax=Halobacterium TaxID=2239 RepID=UPI00073F17B2|nr:MULTISPECIES: site-specific integrase [Halobacterium]MCG1001911.1 site-specific integrase [Halobacterium noricense]